MKKKGAVKAFLAVIFISLLSVSGYFFLENYTQNSSQITQADTEELLKRLEQSLEEGEESSEEEKKGRFNKPRYEYLFKLLRDPATNAIPKDIRSRELRYARTLPTFQQIRSKMKGKGLMIEGFNWSRAGPTDVGGRTRALGIDRRNPNIIIAGGVSGGIWKSTDGGDIWEMKTPELENLSVTSLAQHPVNQDVWYYVSGEFIGNTARAQGAPYYGTGIFRSIDNGETWNRIPSTSDRNTSFSSPYDFMSRIKIHPTTGDIYVASNGFGILRSTDGGNNFNVIDQLGGPGYHAYADVTIASNGDILAVLSSQDALSDPVNNNPGIFLSVDDGQSWTEITPTTFPENYGRSVVAFAPSDPNIAYVLTNKLNDKTTQGVSFHYFNLGTGISEDRSANLPDFRDENGDGSGYMNLQGGYNMLVAVKPDNPDYVFVGGTNLFRSTDGFSSLPPDSSYDANDAAEVDQYWIGGYSQNNNFATYGSDIPGDLHHPDQHVIVFPNPVNNPNIMWSGHDGGLSVTQDVTAPEVHWEDKNSSYIVTQFYTSAIPAEAGDDRLMGGTQDNGTPFFRAGPGTSPNISISSTDISSGDGGYAFFTEDHMFVSQQSGTVIRWNESGTGNITGPFAYVYPAAASEQLFIHPYTIDPNDPDNMYYPDGNKLWRTTEATTIPNGDSDGATSGFSNLTSAAMPSGYSISALEVTRVPANILYYAGSSLNDIPLIYKMENASNSTDTTHISINGAPTGAWVKDIAINPINGNEVIAVMSNYDITGLYHTVNGGKSWTPIEGNLTGNSTNPGPSLRSATIIPSEEGLIYALGTSTGIYTTSLLEGPDTIWGQVATGTVRYAVTDYLSSRISDGDIAAGTHGRGMFLGDFQGNTNAPFIIADPAEARAGQVITLRANDFAFRPVPENNDVKFGDVKAEVISVSSDSMLLKVRVPRGAVDRQAEVNTVTVTVTINGQSIFTSFTILPPNNFALNPNYPNPFYPTTTIPFDLPVESRVTLGIYDIIGQRVLQPLRQTEFNAGTYNRVIDFSGLASGIYIYRVVAESQGGNGQTFIKSRKMTFIK